MSDLKNNQFKEKKLSFLLSILIMSVFILWSLFPSAFCTNPPKEMFAPWQGASFTHYLGTNDMGYDIYSELVNATSITLFTGILAAGISLVVGTAIGVLAGYIDGWVGEIINGIINVFLLIPMLPMTIAVAAFLGAGAWNIILTISLLGWCSTARAVRAKTKQLKQCDFVQSLIILGIPKWRVMFRHIIPNLKDVIFAKYIMSVANCMLMEAAVSFIGLGDTTKVTWGTMINFAFKRGGFTRGALNWYLVPGICIMLCVLSFYYINAYLERSSSVPQQIQESY